VNISPLGGLMLGGLMLGGLVGAAWLSCCAINHRVPGLISQLGIE
jgi:hypothetical protein